MTTRRTRPTSCAHKARAKLFALLMTNPPPPDRVFWCRICGVELRGSTATFAEDSSVTCHDCTGRVPDEPENA